MTEQKVAVITGAARGIGEAIAYAFADAAHAVVLADIDGDGASAVAASLSAVGASAIAVTTNVTSAVDIDAMTAATLKRFGRIDVLVNNAGRNTYFDPIEMTEANWDDALSVDLKSAWLTARAVLPALIQTSGAIVNISSIHGKLTTAGMFPYAVAKSGLEGLTRSLAAEYAPKGVRVNAVAPGWTHTRLVDEWLERNDDPDALARVISAHPLRRIAAPADVAAAVVFLASPTAGAITGAVLPVDAGLSVTFRVD